MSSLRRLWLDDSGSNAVEFGLLAMLFLVFTLGVIDAGMWLWMQNRAQKAMQVAVRHAVVIEHVAEGYANASLVGRLDPDNNQPFAGGAKPDADDVRAYSCNFGSQTCQALPGPGLDIGPFGFDAIAAASILDRAQGLFSKLTPANLEIIYRPVGLGYAGSPAPQPDIYPEVTVRLLDNGPEPLFRPMILTMLTGGSIRLTGISATQTMEDGAYTGTAAVSFSS